MNIVFSQVNLCVAPLLNNKKDWIHFLNECLWPKVEVDICVVEFPLSS